MAGAASALELSRTFLAARERVFAAFADADLLARWWGPRGFTVPDADWHPAAGADFRVDMQPPDGPVFRLTGTFRAVDPPARLAFTFRWDPPDADDVETVADLAFDRAGDATEVRLHQGPFRTEERRALHHAGWTDAFDRLAGLLAEDR